MTDDSPGAPTSQSVPAAVGPAPASSPTAPRRKWSNRRRAWLFAGLTVLLSAGLLELLSLVVWLTFPPVQRSSLEKIQQDIALVGNEHRSEVNVLHPYLGWVLNPDAAQSADEAEVNSFGFADSGPSIVQRSDDRLVIGVFGGSVAQHLTKHGEKALRDRLAASPLLQGREIRIVKLALGAYKQPQQLMTLNYMLALGGQFDVVVNVDGYNETGLAAGENNRFHVFASYPRMWNIRLQDVVDPRVSSQSFRLLTIRATRQSRARWILGSPLRHTWTGSLVWALLDESLKREQSDLAIEALSRAQTVGRGFALQGPTQMYSNDEEMYSHLADVWRNGSLQMHHLCKGRGFRYLHFLQPNQYHEGSKPLNEFELANFYRPNDDQAQAARKGYPHLIEAGRRLQADGVPFHDLSGLFAGYTETLYSDPCCHYNQRGTNLLAEAVADRILEALSDR